MPFKFSPGHCGEGGCSCGVDCGGCPIPARNLTLTWTNSLSGGGSTTLVFDGVDVWESACIGTNKRYRFECIDGVPSLKASYFSGGDCPGGASTSCQSPTTLPPVSQICTPFLFSFKTYNVSPFINYCPAFSSLGFILFTITE